MRPDFLIQKRVAQDNHYAACGAYANKMKSISQNSSWFEQKTKYDFNDGEKRSEAFIKQEMDCANAELKTRRQTRLKLLYENEARAYEQELGELGLAIQRMNY